MGLFDIFKNITKETSVVKEKNIVNKNETENYYNDDEVIELFNGGKDEYTNEQRIALFLHSMNYSSKIKNKDEYPSYMTYSYKILDIPKYHLNLINDGYFKKTTIESLLKKYKLNELQDVVKYYQLDVKKTKKEEMIKNIIDNLSEKQINEIIDNSNCYELSDKGLNYLNDYNEFLTLYDRYDWRISYSLYTKYKNNLPNYLKLRDVVWQIFNDRLNKSFLYNKFDISYSTYFNMAKFLEEENKFTDALYYYIVCLYYEINYFNIQSMMISWQLNDKETKEYFIRLLNMKPTINNVIVAIKGLEEHKSDRIFEKLFSIKQLPYEFISNNDFKSMIEDIFNEPVLDENKYIDIAKFNATNIINNL